MSAATPKIILSLWALALPFSGFTQELAKYQWKNRLILLFAPTPTDTNYQIQMDSFHKNEQGMNDRKLVVLSVFPDSITSTDDKAWTYKDVRNLRTQYLPKGRESAFLLIGLDGGIKWRTDLPASTEELFSRIDVMPMRRREIENSDDNGGH